MHEETIAFCGPIRSASREAATQASQSSIEGRTQGGQGGQARIQAGPQAGKCSAARAETHRPYQSKNCA
jgi:hypothetical protein